MAADTLDRLLTTLEIRVHAFAMCAIKAGWRLLFDPMEAVTIHYVLAGSGSVRTIEGIDIAYGPCSIIVVPARVPQSLGEAGVASEKASAADNCSLLADGLVRFTAGDGSRDTAVVCATISASYAGALGLFDHLRAPVVEMLPQGSAIQTLFEVMLAEISQPGLGTKALTEALMKQCLILLLRQHLVREGIRSPFFAIIDDHRLTRAVVAVLDRPAGAHSVQSLAAIAGMSRSSFAARFGQVFEQTPMEFVQLVRLRLGCNLLQTTRLPIKVIAASVGYGSRSYFSRAFRAAHGIDPKNYRIIASRDEAVIRLAASPSLSERVDAAVEGLFEDEDA